MQKKKNMKKKILSAALICLMTVETKAQVYAGDTWMQMPTADLYDTGMMNMYLRALAETAARRKAEFEQFCRQAETAFQEQQWQTVINRVNWALSTKYYNGDIFYMRGYAYESLGDLKAAKKDYKKGKKYGSYRAATALDALKNKRKQKK